MASIPGEGIYSIGWNLSIYSRDCRLFHRVESFPGSVVYSRGRITIQGMGSIPVVGIHSRGYSLFQGVESFPGESILQGVESIPGGGIYSWGRSLFQG